MERSNHVHRHGRRLAVVVALLLLHLLLRTPHTDRQDPYVDEAFHIKRAAVVWDFDANPGRFAHGKVLVYYWLGLFETAPTLALHTSRLAMALFSLVSGAAIYQIGRTLHSHAAGAASLGLYAVLPLAVFYERMAMADPFASGFAALVAWQGVILARRPAWGRAVLVGLLLALATLAKLTLALLPTLPVLAAILFAGARHAPVRRWLNTYAPLMAAAGVVMLLAWLPLLVPYRLALGTDDAYTLVDSYNLRSSEEDSAPVQVYGQTILPLLADFTSRGLLIAAAGAWIGLAGAGRARLRTALYLGGWLGLIVLLPVGAARLATVRYFMPVAAPLALIVGIAAAEAWRISRTWARGLLRAGIVLGALAWGIGFALPFNRAAITDPRSAPLHDGNYREYISGYLSGDDVTQGMAALINALDPPPTHLYANWNFCHLLYLYSERPIACFGLNRVPADLAPRLHADLAPGEVAYLALNTALPAEHHLSGLCVEEAARSYGGQGVRLGGTLYRVRVC